MSAGDLPRLDGADGMRVGALIARPGAVVCVGLNYAAHPAESGVGPPTQPVIFLKTPNTVGGPKDNVRVPLRSNKTDWEVELGVVIGRPASYPERTFQPEESGGQWSKGKCCPGFTPTGPWLVTPEEIDHGSLAAPTVVPVEGRSR
jgi:2-keto-4-pentenoate hydratase/2-oxohepta-3-ene-1,7-dioic acid hydratase in catechol pathway